MTTSRRDFLRSASAVSLAACIPIWRRTGEKVDVVIRGGTVFDGSLAATGIDADVALNGGRVVAIGRRLAQTGRLEVDARGQAVAPGFMDVHSHGDNTLFLDPNGESMIRQGVTTVVVGQDGSSHGPRAGADEESDSASLKACLRRGRQAARGGQRRVGRRAGHGARRGDGQREPAGDGGRTRQDGRARRTGARRGRVRRLHRPRVHAGRFCPAQRTDRVQQAAGPPPPAVQHAHAQRGRPAARVDRRVDCRGARRGVPAADLAPQDPGAAQLGQARRRVRQGGGRGARPASTPRSTAIRTSPTRRGFPTCFRSGRATARPRTSCGGSTTPRWPGGSTSTPRRRRR